MTAHRLPIEVIAGRQYYRDDRLKEYRHVDNPHVRIPFDGVDLDNVEYQLCARCDHFGDEDGHYEDGEQEFDHGFTPSGLVHTLKEWKRRRPELFEKYPDGKIGPNSIHHSRRGKE